MDAPITETKKPKLFSVKLDINLFQPAALSDEVSLEAAISILESHLANTAVDKQTLLLQLLKQPCLFEFVISGRPMFRLSYLHSEVVDYATLQHCLSPDMTAF